CYETGEGIEKNEEKAVEWFQKAADNKSSYGEANLGRCNQYGIGTKKKIDQAVKYYQASASQASPYGQTLLAWCYEHGYGIKQDLKKALTLYRTAADKGWPLAASNLSRCYQKGIGIAMNETEAVKWTEKAKLDYEDNANFFALCYTEGWGVEPDLAQAQWWKKTAEIAQRSPTTDLRDDPLSSEQNMFREEQLPPLEEPPQTHIFPESKEKKITDKIRKRKSFDAKSKE